MPPSFHVSDFRSHRKLWPVLSAAAMREADRLTIESFSIPSAMLMETAGRYAADCIEDAFGPVDGKRIVCLCGSGNNGGDGLVIARVLLEYGASVQVVTIGGRSKMTREAYDNVARVETLSERSDHLELLPLEELERLDVLSSANIYVDALLGAGLSTPPRSPVDRLVTWLNEQTVPVVAVDIPTGLHSDTGAILGEAVRAELTVTMAAMKAGLLIGEGPKTTGAVEVVDIGIPNFLIDEAMAKHPEGCAWYPTDRAIREWLPQRPPDAHKYTAGLALVVAGSPGMSGAPRLASAAAACAGAGFVTCASFPEIQDILAGHLVEATTLPLPTARDGGLDPDKAMGTLEERLGRAKALLVGPGLGQHDSTKRFIRRLLREVELPVVIDADGLNAMADEPGFLKEHGNARWVLTPHLGEFKRLAGEDVDTSDLIRTARTYARRWKSVLILKGQPSLVATPEGRVFVNSTGNAALATAGTGDVLAGMTTGLLAQGLDPEPAALCALHVGGACSERYASTHGLSTMVASDILRELPFVLHERYQH